MKTYKEFINKAKPVELDEAPFAPAIPWLYGVAKTAPIWGPPLLKKAAIVTGVGGAVYDWDQKMKGKKGIFPDVTKIFNRGKTTDAINDILWRDTDTKTKKTDIPDGIGKDIYNPGNLKTDRVDKTNTQVGDGTAGTAVGGQSDVGGRIGSLSQIKAISNTGAISNAAVKSKKIPFKSFRLKGRLPTTPHNVGRRVNPQ